jgi:hypothetical protein
MSSATAACVFIVFLVAIIGTLIYFLVRKKSVTTVIAPTTPKMDQALKVELQTMAERATVTVKADAAREELKTVTELPDSLDKLARLAKLVKSAKNL